MHVESYLLATAPIAQQCDTNGDAKSSILGRFETKIKTISTLKHEKLIVPRELGSSIAGIQVLMFFL
jgi:hypothetical protein